MINCLFATAIVFYILVPCVLSFSQKKHQIKVEEHLRSGNTRKFLLWSTLIHYFFSDIKLVKKKKMTAWVIQIPFFFQGQISQTTSFCIFLDLVSCPVSPDCACVSSVIPYQCRDGISVTFSTGSWMPGGVSYFLPLKIAALCCDGMVVTVGASPALLHLFHLCDLLTLRFKKMSKLEAGT